MVKIKSTLSHLTIAVLAFALGVSIAYAADVAISALTALTGAGTADNDELVIVDVSEATAADRTKKIDVSELQTKILTGNAATSTALAANGANCTAGQAPLGVDASGAVEGCADITSFGEPWDNSPPALEGVLIDPIANFYFFDDFTGSIINDLPVGWTIVTADTGATVTYNQSDPHGAVLDISNSTTASGTTFEVGRSVILNGSRDLYIEVRVNIEDEDDQDFYFGIREGGTLTNSEDAWDASSGSFMGFGIADGDATPHLIYRDSGGTIQFDDSSTDIVEGTWHTMAVYFDASGPTLTGYLDGVLVATASVTADLDEALLGAPFLGTRNGSSAAHNTLVDYYGLVSDR
jgi:hypothetical protein